ncbi:hypothetical protein TruAng_003302 [Truncatella angustata]|nr:hypothetical protein TruAng_003302 [Truncatella angustata]
MPTACEYTTKPSATIPGPSGLPQTTNTAECKVCSVVGQNNNGAKLRVNDNGRYLEYTSGDGWNSAISRTDGNRDKEDCGSFEGPPFITRPRYAVELTGSRLLHEIITGGILITQTNDTGGLLPSNALLLVASQQAKKKVTNQSTFTPVQAQFPIAQQPIMRTRSLQQRWPYPPYPSARAQPRRQSIRP